MSNPPILQKESVLVSTLIVVCGILFFFNLGGPALWNIDEGMHAATSKDMVLNNDWLTPQYNGEKFYDKPPLHNWLVAISFLLFGFTEFAARLPAAMLGLGSVMVTYILGRRIYGPTAAFLSGLVLATSLEFFLLSRVVVHDISLAFFITLALTCFYLGYENEGRRRLLFPLGYAAMGLAVLAKGPIGFLIPIAVIGLFLLLRRRLNFISELQIGWGIIILFAVGAPWYIFVSIKDPEFLQYFFVKQNLSRFFASDVRHPEPFYFYVPLLLAGMFPWSPFLPLALYKGIRSSKTGANGGTLFALIWFTTVFLFFSFASSKLGTYILPLFPAAALLVGAFLYQAFKCKGADDKGLLYSYLPLVLILTVTLLYFILFPPLDLVAEGGLSMVRIYWITALLVAGCILCLILITRQKYWMFMTSTVGIVIGVFLLSLFFLVPQIEPYRSGKDLARKIDKLLAPADHLVFYEKAGDTFLFYTDRMAVVLETPQELKNYLASDKQVFCIIRMKDWKEIKTLHETMHIVAQKGNRKIVSNRKPRI